MEISPDTAFVLCCCLFWAGVILGAFGWDLIRSHTHRAHAATAEEKAIARRMAREYRSHLRDVKRGPHVG